MSDFKAKMHQIRCRLGLCPRPPAGGATALPQTPAGFKGPYTSKERREEGRGGEGRERRGEREGREGKGREGRGREGREVDTPKFFYLDPRLWAWGFRF